MGPDPVRSVSWTPVRFWESVSWTVERFSDPSHLLQSALPIQVPLASYIQDGGPGSASAVTGSGVIRSATDDWSMRRAAAFLVAGVTGRRRLSYKSHSRIGTHFCPWLKKTKIFTLWQDRCAPFDMFSFYPSHPVYPSENRFYNITFTTWPWF